MSGGMATLLKGASCFCCFERCLKRLQCFAFRAAMITKITADLESSTPVHRNDM